MSDKSGSTGIWLSGLLAIVFIVLKLIGVIDWPWIWVLAPTWIGLIVGVLIIIGAIALVYIAENYL